ncbi:MAG: hypothetical protein ACXW4T_02430 [Candidatus Limnocylindrales bacterium]
MHDSLIEDQLRNVLRDEARSLPFELTVGTLERRLVERRLRHSRRRWLVAAAVGALAVTGAAAILVGIRGDQPSVAATPSPSTTPRPTLPEPAALIASFPDATVRLEHAVGPAGGPLGSGSSPSPDATPPAPIEVGRVRFEGPFVIGVACIGEGDILVEISTPSLGIAYTQAHGPCDGTPIHSEYLAPPIDPASPGDAVTVRVDPGASWRLAIGVYPIDLSTPPSFAPIVITEGWHLVSDVGTQLLTAESPRTGARINVPTGATAVAVLLQCQGDGPVTVTSVGALPVEVACDPSGPTRRIELPAVGGESLSLGATVDGGRTWVRLLVEANAAIADTYPAAPPMPPDLALTPYAAPDRNVVGLGTLGARRQTIVELQGATPGRPAGDRLPVSLSDQTDGSRLDLLAIPSGDVIRTIATVPAPSFIFDSWIDPSHERVFFAVARKDVVEFHQVSTDGSDDTLLATIPGAATTGFTAALAGDDTTFVIDWCVAGQACTRVIVDGPTGAVRTVERSGDPVCRIVGIADGTLIGTTRAVCRDESSTALVAVPLAGGPPRVLASDATGGLSGGAVVVTRKGLQVVIDTAFSESGPAVGIIDVGTGQVTPLMVEVEGAVLTPTRLRMPPGWVLMSSGMLGDFPWQRAFDRPTPVAVNLDTGDRIELGNLPHWLSTLP